MDELSDAQIASRVKVKEMQHQKEMQANKYDQEKLRWERKEKSKSKEWLRNSLPIILLLAISISCFVLSEIHFNSEEKTSIKQEEQLQQIVEEVMIDIKNEDFVSARIKAETIYYTENWSDEIEKKWDATRKQLLKEIDAAEKIKRKRMVMMVDGSIGLIKQSNDYKLNRYTIYDINLVVSGHVESVVKLVRK